MAPRTLGGLSTVLAAAANVPDALRALAHDVSEHDRNANIVLYIYDARREVLCERLIPALDGAKTALSQTVSIVDKMATKGIIHRNTAGRYKSRLASRLTKASA